MAKMALNPKDDGFVKRSGLTYDEWSHIENAGCCAFMGHHLLADMFRRKASYDEFDA